MIFFPYPKPTKCYGDTVIRRAVFLSTFLENESTTSVEIALNEKKMIIFAIRKEQRLTKSHKTIWK